MRNKEDVEKRKREISDVFLLADLIAEYIGRSIAGSKAAGRPSQPWDRFPKLFKDERERYEKNEVQNQLEDYKMRKKAYAAEFNRRRSKQKMIEG